MASAEGVFPKVGNDPLFNSEINTFADDLQQIYIGSGFDSSTFGSNTGSFEMTAIPAGSINHNKYLNISVLGFGEVRNGGVQNSNATASVKIETKEVGGTYADSLATQTFLKQQAISTSPKQYKVDSTHSLNWIHTLSAAELASGVQARITSICSASGTTNGIGSFANVQAITRLLR